MEIKLSVSVGATIQVKNARGEWDWIKPEVGCEVKLIDGEIKPEIMPDQFAAIWDDIVGPQFSNVVLELLLEQVPDDEEEADDDEVADEKPNTDEDDYY